MSQGVCGERAESVRKSSDPSVSDVLTPQHILCGVPGALGGGVSAPKSGTLEVPGALDVDALPGSPVQMVCRSIRRRSNESNVHSPVLLRVESKVYSVQCFM